MASTDYYTILGLERGATEADIKKAFRRQAQQWHPDVSADPAAAERFKELNEAYQVLSDPERRQRYDLFGAAGVGGDAGPGFGGFADIFDAFFGANATAGSRRGRPAAGSDLRYDLRITFEEAIRATAYPSTTKRRDETFSLRCRRHAASVASLETPHHLLVARTCHG